MLKIEMQVAQDIIRFRLSYDWLLGVLAAVPFAYPAEPFYWIAMLAFLLALPRFRLDQRDVYRLCLIVAIWIIVLVSNFAISNQYSPHLPSIAGSVVVFGLFMFACGLRDIDRFFDGFLAVITVYVVLTFFFFVFLKPYTHGSEIFIISELRMWGDGYLLEWPNVFCAFLCVGFYIRWLRGELMMAFLTLGAAILTTSRIALVALGLSVIFGILNSQKASYWGILIIVAAVTIIILVSVSLSPDYIDQRLLKITDRAIILDNSLAVFNNNPFGVGNVRFDQISEFYASYHSSFLKILVRYGVVGFLLFLLLIKPRYLWQDKFSKINALLLFIIIIGTFQDMLLHMHMILIYSALLSYREDKMVESFAAR